MVLLSRTHCGSVRPGALKGPERTHKEGERVVRPPGLMSYSPPTAKMIYLMVTIIPVLQLDCSNNRVGMMFAFLGPLKVDRAVDESDMRVRLRVISQRNVIVRVDLLREQPQPPSVGQQALEEGPCLVRSSSKCSSPAALIARSRAPQTMTWE